MFRWLRTLGIVLGLAAAVSACGTPPAERAVDSGAVPSAQPATPAASSVATPPTATTPPSVVAAPPAVAGPARENAYLRVQVTEAGFSPDRPAPVGLRYYTVGLRGTSRSDSDESLMGRSKGNDVLVDVRRFVFAENQSGCLSRPERNVQGVADAIGDSITFPPTGHAAGRLVFLVPDDTERVRVIFAPTDEGRLVVPAGADFTPSWPTPVHTIADGTTLRVLVLPPIAKVPSALPAPAAGREHVVLDLVIQNLKTSQGVEFQTSQQLRLVDGGGRFIQPSALTARLGCRLDDGDVIPAGHTRRLQIAYDMLAGASRRLQYRGFETDEATVELGR